MYRILALETNEYLLAIQSVVITPPRLILYSNHERKKRLDNDCTDCELYEVESNSQAWEDLKFTLELEAGIQLTEKILYKCNKYFSFEDIKVLFEIVEV